MMSDDYLKEVLYSQQLSPLVLIMVLTISFILGAIHALGPGHGKSLMAAYLVGSRGHLRDVFILATSITISHVISVIMIGIIALLLMDFFWSEKASIWISMASGIFIIMIGVWLLVKRFNIWKKVRFASGRTGLKKQKVEVKGSDPDTQPPDSNATSQHHTQTHKHHEESRRHLSKSISIWSNVGLGISAGLVPCPKALVILLLAISLQKITLGITIIIVFSLGLAVVLVILGIILVKASYLLEERFEDQRIQFLPVLGSCIIIVLGLFLIIRTWQLF